MGRKQRRLRQEKRESTWARVESEIRDLVRRNLVELCSHVLDKVATNYWTLDDVLNSLRAGSIRDAQVDEHHESVDGKKYIFIGPDLYGNLIETVGKIVADDEGGFYLVITAY